MLNPCSPCVCPGAPCEQCTFGYQPMATNHESMKKLLLAVDAGEKPSGWQCAELYQQFHSNWRDELNEHKVPVKLDPDKEEKPMLKVKILSAQYYLDLEEKVNEFINREEVGQIHEIRFSDHAVLIMYETRTVPEFFET